MSAPSPWHGSLHSSLSSYRYQQNHTEESRICPLEVCQEEHSAAEKWIIAN